MAHNRALTWSKREGLNRLRLVSAVREMSHAPPGDDSHEAARRQAFEKAFAGYGIGANKKPSGFVSERLFSFEGTCALVIVAGQALGLGDMLEFDSVFQAGAGIHLTDSAALDGLPRCLAGGVLIATGGL